MLLARRADVEELHEHREAHREVDEALLDVLAEALRREHDTDEQQERERQHLERRMLLDEPAHGARRDQHHEHRDDHRRDHDRQLVGHAHRGDDRVQREHDVQDHDLDDHRGERAGGLDVAGVLLALEPAVDLPGRLGDEEQAAAEQDEVAPGDVAAGHREQRLRQPDHPADGEQQQDAHAHGREQAHLSRSGLLLHGQLAREDRDEHDVVDAQHDLEGRERDQGDPGIRDWSAAPRGPPAAASRRREVTASRAGHLAPPGRR